LNDIAVFASAKEEVSKPTGLCRKCCKTDEVESLSPFPNGITRLIIPCYSGVNSECNINHHIITPPKGKELDFNFHAV
jgi:hypothetical protein